VSASVGVGGECFKGLAKEGIVWGAGDGGGEPGDRKKEQVSGPRKTALQGKKKKPRRKHEKIKKTSGALGTSRKGH